jgi:hypothetical protein
LNLGLQRIRDLFSHHVSVVRERSDSLPKMHKRILSVGWFKIPVSSPTHKLMAATNFSDYLGLKHYKKAKKIKNFIHLRLANWPQSFNTYHTIHGLLNRWTSQYDWGNTTGWLERIVNILQISDLIFIKLSVCTSMRVIVLRTWSTLTLAMP